MATNVAFDLPSGHAESVHAEKIKAKWATPERDAENECGRKLHIQYQ